MVLKIKHLYLGCVICCLAICMSFVFFSCTFYRFSAATIPPEINTIFIEQFSLQSSITDINFLPEFRNTFMDLTSNRTKLVIVENREEADWVIEGILQRYDVNISLASNTTNVVSGQAPEGTQTTLNVSIKATLVDRVSRGEDKTLTITDKYVATGDKTPLEIQDEAREDLIGRMTQNLFNQIYANW